MSHMQQLNAGLEMGVHHMMLFMEQKQHTKNRYTIEEAKELLSKFKRMCRELEQQERKAEQWE